METNKVCLLKILLLPVSDDVGSSCGSIVNESVVSSKKQIYLLLEILMFYNIIRFLFLERR